MKRLKVALIFLLFYFQFANGQFENYDIKNNNIKQLKKTFLKFRDNDSVSREYGYQIYFDSIGRLIKKETWHYFPIETDTTTDLYLYSDDKLIKIIFKNPDNYDQIQYDSLGFLAQINRIRDGSVNSSFYLKNDNKGRLIERHIGTLEYFEYDSLGRVINSTKSVAGSVDSVNFSYSEDGQLEKEIRKTYEGGNKIMTITAQYEYNTKNDISRSIWYYDYDRSAHIGLYSYIYNDQGDWIYKLTVWDQKIYGIETREIEYY